LWYAAMYFEKFDLKIRECDKNSHLSSIQLLYVVL
jgi:hypothetical protein